MANVENINYSKDFDKERRSELDIVFRTSALGESNSHKVVFFLDDQTIHNIKSDTKSTVSQEKLLNGSIENLLHVMVEQAYQNRKYNESKLGGDTYSGPNEVNTVSSDMDPSELPALKAVYDRVVDLKGGKSIDISIEQKPGMISISDIVKNHVGLLTIEEDGVKKSETYIIDIILGKDVSGGYRD